MHVYQIICCSCSLFFNTTLAFLIIFKSPTKLGIYKYLMLYISIFEVVYSILDVVVGPTFHSHGGAFVVFQYYKNVSYSREISIFIVSAYCGCFGFSIAVFGVHFIYRYGAVESTFYETYLSGKKILILFIVPFAYYLWWAGLIYTFLPSTPETDRYMGESILETYGFHIEDLSYVCLLYHPVDQNGVSHPDWPKFGMVFCFFFMMASSMSCVLYFGLQCYLKIKRTLEASRHISKLTKNLQQQLFQALVIQTMIPLVLMYSPAAVIFLSSMFQIKLGFNTTFVGFTIATYPAIDPLPNMLIIKSYRNAIKRYLSTCFRRPFAKVGHSQPTVHTNDSYSNTVIVPQLLE